MPNPFHDQEELKENKIKEAAESTRVVYDFKIDDKTTKGIKERVLRCGIIMYVYVNEQHEIEILYKDEDIEKHMNEIFDFYESHCIFEN